MSTFYNGWKSEDVRREAKADIRRIGWARRRIQFNLRPACYYCNENKRRLDVRRRLF
jgi:hypothetical protein